MSSSYSGRGRGRGGGAAGGSSQAGPGPRRLFEQLLQDARFSGSGTSASQHYDDERDCPIPTHYDMFGGKYLVDDRAPEMEENFDAMLVEALREGGVYALSENRTQFSALYFDLDFRGDEGPVEIEELTEIAGTVVGTVARLGGFEPDLNDLWREASTIYVAAAEPVCGEDRLWKTGLHLVLPDVVLTRSQMVRVAQAVRDATERKLGPRQPPQNSWTDVFDLAVYRGGLRMLLVDKPEPCPRCTGVTRPGPEGAPEAAPAAPASRKRQANRERPACAEPNCRAGKVPSGRRYLPVACFRAPEYCLDTDAIKRLRSSPFTALRTFTIRRPRARLPSPMEPDFSDAEAFSPEFEEMRLMPGKRSLAGSSAGRAALESVMGGVVRGANTIMLLNTDPRLVHLQRAVRAYDDRFAHLSVRSAVCNRVGTQYVVQVAGHGRHACMNCLKGTEHSRAFVQFVVDAERGVCQRCCSRSEKTERATGKPCKAFAGPWVRCVPPEAAPSLFGGIQTATSVNLPLVIDNGRVWLPADAIVEDIDLSRPVRAAAAAAAEAASTASADLSMPMPAGSPTASAGAAHREDNTPSSDDDSDGAATILSSFGSMTGSASIFERCTDAGSVAERFAEPPRRPKHTPSVTAPSLANPVLHIHHPRFIRVDGEAKADAEDEDADEDAEAAHEGAEDEGAEAADEDAYESSRRILLNVPASSRLPCYDEAEADADEEEDEEEAGEEEAGEEEEVNKEEASAEEANKEEAGAEEASKEEASAEEEAEADEAEADEAEEEDDEDDDEEDDAEDEAEDEEDDDAEDDEEDEEEDEAYEEADEAEEEDDAAYGGTTPLSAWRMWGSFADQDDCRPSAKLRRVGSGRAQGV
jgi:hypothetical protein